MIDLDIFAIRRFTCVGRDGVSVCGLVHRELRTAVLCGLRRGGAGVAIGRIVPADRSKLRPDEQAYVDRLVARCLGKRT